MNDGGPAFPVSVADETWHANRGMTLRDWFAGQALVGALHPTALEAANAVAKTLSVKAENVVAILTYDYADAMLAERAKRKDAP